MNARISRCTVITTQNRVFGGAWLGYVTHQNNNVYLLFVMIVKKHTPMETHTSNGDKCGNANIWIEILQCTRKTLARLNNTGTRLLNLVSMQINDQN